MKCQSISLYNVGVKEGKLSSFSIVHDKSSQQKKSPLFSQPYGTHKGLIRSPICNQLCHKSDKLFAKYTLSQSR